MRVILMCAAALALSACSGSPQLRDLRTNSGGPDEFTSVPTKPLTQPESYSDLPAPTPHGTNLTDPTPVADAIAAMGGNANAAIAGGIPTADGALMARANRYGTNPAIRAELADADARFRKRKATVGFLGFTRSNRYYSAYASQALNAYAELTRFRNAGVKTPSAPPQ